MAGNAIINIKFAADLKQFSSSMQNATRSIKRMGKQMQSVGTNLSVGLTAPFLAFSGVALKNFDTQDKAVAQLNAGLQSTGRFTEALSKKLQEQASILQNNSLFGDEDILKNSTAQILSFTNIATDTIPRVNQVVADLATRLGTDLKSNAIQVSKALNDPIANLSALGRSGIQFSEDQKATIKSLVQTNKLAEAQNIILKELETQYGGSAKAAAEAGTGGIKQLFNSIGDLTESFGKIINEAIKPFVENVKDAVSAVENWSPATKKMALVIGGLGAALGPVMVTLGLLMTNVVPGLITAFGAVKIAFTSLTTVIAANPFGALAVAIGLVASAFLVFNNNVKDTVRQQNVLADINTKATKSIVNEKAKLEELLFIARNENIQKSARIKAIKELNKLSPKYLGDLTLEKINTDSAKDALKLYNEELLKTAKIKAAQTKLQELQSKIIDLELRQQDASIANAKEQQAINNNLNLSPEQRKKLLSAVNDAKSLGLMLSQKELESLKEQEQQILNIIAAQKTGSFNTTTTPTTTTNTVKTKLENPVLQGAGFDLPKVDIAGHFEKQAKSVSDSLGSIQNKFNAFKNASVEIGNAVGGAFANMSNRMLASFVNSENGFQRFVGQLGQTITELIAMYLSQSIASSIAGATASGTATGPAAIFSTPAFIATAVGGVLAAFAAIPSFNNGGIMPGNSFTGDKLFARINSGEMVLNKRQQGNLVGMLNPIAPNVTLNVTAGAKIRDRELIYFIEEGKKKLIRTQS